MMDWITNINEVIALVTGLVGLITAGVGAYYAVKNFIALTKEKSKNEIWAMVMTVADSAMQEAERSGKSGADKKTMAISIVKESCKSAGLEIDQFLDQLDLYIDDTIAFLNRMSKKSK